MGEIKLKYAWSNSRVNTLRECMYKYYLQYFESWQGWQHSAPDNKKKAYLLKNLTNLPMFAGSVVHEVIEKVLKQFIHQNKWIPIQQAQKMGKNLLNQGWQQSKNQLWKDKVKGNVNLFEHYYNQSISKEQITKIGKLVNECIRAFYDLEIIQKLHSSEKTDILSLEDFQKFNLNTGEEVTVKIDFGFKHNNKVYLIDWKTGKANNNVIDQLITYSMYAVKMGWAKKIEDVIIVPVYLAACIHGYEQCATEIVATTNQARRQANIIREESKLLAEAHKNKDNPQFFKRTTNARLCARCNFKEICPGAASIGEEEELSGPFDESNMVDEVKLFFDGGIRKGNMALGYFVTNINDDKDILFSDGKKCGKDGTSNIAEYRALIAGLQSCLDNGVKCVEIYGDSQLIVKQVCGDYIVRNENLKVHYEKVHELLKNFEKWNIHWIPRSKNKMADYLVNKVFEKHA